MSLSHPEDETPDLPEGLVYVSDQMPGITRQTKGKSVTFMDARGKPLTSERALKRVSELVIPPAWQDVWICPSANGHLQVTGRDEKGRKQSIYHADWQSFRSEVKFERQAEFGRALPRIRKAIEHDLKLPKLPKNKVLAGVLRLLDTTLIRVGNQRYANENKSYGLTTFKNKHVSVKGSELEFRFLGKSKKSHLITVEDPIMARIVRKLQELPGQRLFGYLDDDGEAHSLDSRDVNRYLAEISRSNFTAKDFRTWAASAETLRLLREERPQSARALAKVVKEVSLLLGNTPSVCRQHYIHPLLIQDACSGAWLETKTPRKAKFLSGVERLYLDQVLKN